MTSLSSCPQVTGVPLPAWGSNSTDRLGYDGTGRMITKRYLTGGIDETTNAYTNTTCLVGATTSFDRASNKLYERHLEAESRSHLYQPFNPNGSLGVGYDSANRLLQYQRGVLNGDGIPYRVPTGASIDIPTTLPGADQVRTYGLDGLGNWKTTNFTLVGSGGSTTSTAEVRQHNYVNEITSVRDTVGSGSPATTPFTYDKNGNLLNDGVRIYTYDALNRLMQVSDVATSAVLATYAYDTLNRRTFKNIVPIEGTTMGGLTGDIPAKEIYYSWYGQQVFMEADGADDWSRVYVWGQYIDELMLMVKGRSDEPTGTYRVLSDLLYRSVALVDTSNTIVEAYDCDAYGNTMIYSGPGTDGLWFTDDDVRTNNPVNNNIFTGRDYDPESQIYYYRARYYSPNIGRFISRDPLPKAELRQGPNLYGYVHNNAVNGLDPKGKDHFGCQIASYSFSGSGWQLKAYNLQENTTFASKVQGIWTADVSVICCCLGQQCVENDTRVFFSKWQPIQQNTPIKMPGMPPILAPFPSSFQLEEFGYLFMEWWLEHEMELEQEEINKFQSPLSRDDDNLIRNIYLPPVAPTKVDDGDWMGESPCAGDKECTPI